MAQQLRDSPNDSGWTGSGPVFGTGYRLVPPPTVFSISYSTDKTILVFTIGDPPIAAIRRTKASYRVYFAPIELGSPTVISSPFQAQNVFNQSSMIGSTNAPQNGGTTTIRDTLHAGLDGWFFATAVNLYGVESNFIGPLRNPIIGVNDSRVPDDVTGQTAVLSDGGLDPWGRQLVDVTITCLIPGFTNSVSTITVADGGTNYTENPTVTITGGGGTGAMAVAEVESFQVQNIRVTAPGTGYTSIPTVTITGGGSPARNATAVASLTSSGSFSGVQIYLDNYFNEGNLVEGPHFANGSNTPGQLLRGVMTLEQDTSVGAHAVTLYFVSLSQTGTRLDDPTLAPSVVLATGVHP